MGTATTTSTSYAATYGASKGLLFMMGIFLGILGNSEVESLEEEISDLVVTIPSNSLATLLGLKTKTTKI